VKALGEQAVQEILHAVLSFKEEDFRESFDPWGLDALQFWPTGVP
jgi:hypothetical protein